MQRLKYWIEAFRLRTLFLALASVITGSLMALNHPDFSVLVFLLTLLTTISLQILSNLANDYGDSEKGTDNQNRVGPERTLQSGKISRLEMKRLIVAFVLISLIFGVSLLYFSLSVKALKSFLLFLFLGIMAIVAALKYTIGKKSFGYLGFGDLFVFVFFGIVGVFGSNYLQTHTIDLQLLLPSFSIGFFSVGVLNLNNMRDIENDGMFNKKTIPVRFGLARAKTYHYVIIALGWIAILEYSLLHNGLSQHLIVLLAFPLFVNHMRKVFKREGAALDPLLKQLSLSTFLFAVLVILAFTLSI